MKRYFIAQTDDMPTVEDNAYGHYHYIELCTHGDAGENHNLICLEDRVAVPHTNWIALPPLLDQSTKISMVLDHTLLTDIGLTGEETTLQVALLVGEIHPDMGL